MGTQLSSQNRGLCTPKFSAHLYCSQTAGWIKMPLGTEVGSAYATLCSMWTHLPAEKGHTHPTQFLAHVYCGQIAGWMKTPLGTEVDLGPGHILLDGVPAPAKGTQRPPSFRLMSIVVTVAHLSLCWALVHLNNRARRSVCCMSTRGVPKAGGIKGFIPPPNCHALYHKGTAQQVRQSAS